MRVSLEFMECAVCAAKPGSPTLCASCLHNRTVISALNETIDKLPRLTRLIAMANELASRNK